LSHGITGKGRERGGGLADREEGGQRRGEGSKVGGTAASAMAIWRSGGDTRLVWVSVGMRVCVRGGCSGGVCRCQS